MAKKKAVKKKAVKKKAVKKKAVKKKAVRKMAVKKKKPATQVRYKTSTRERGQAGAAPVREIRYRCLGGACTATPKFAHITPGDTIDLVAMGTDVTITFVGGSPFLPPTNPINIASGNTDQRVVGETHGEFEYTLRCSACFRTSVTNPEMIVP
jgi:hypothetical protein